MATSPLPKIHAQIRIKCDSAGCLGLDFFKFMWKTLNLTWKSSLENKILKMKAKPPKRKV
jgi:hypothetical protein